jgi:hypothetical protein
MSTVNISTEIIALKFLHFAGHSSCDYNPTYLLGKDQENCGSGQLGMNWETISKITSAKWAGGIVRAALCKSKVLNSILSTSKKKSLCTSPIHFTSSSPQTLSNTENFAFCIVFF